MNGSIITYSEYLQHFNDAIESEADRWDGKYKTYGEMWIGENYFVNTPINILELSNKISELTRMQIESAYKEGMKAGFAMAQDRSWWDSLGEDL